MHFTLHSCTQFSAFTDGYTESTNDLHWQVPHDYITEIRLEYSSIVAQTGSDAVLFSIFHFITGEALPLFILYTLDTPPFYHFKSIWTQHISTSVLFPSCLPDAISSHLSVYFSYITFLTGVDGIGLACHGRAWIGTAWGLGHDRLHEWTDDTIYRCVWSFAGFLIIMSSA